MRHKSFDPCRGLLDSGADPAGEEGHGEREHRHLVEQAAPGFL
jgi:hypothetical protein